MRRQKAEQERASQDHATTHRLWQEHDEELNASRLSTQLARSVAVCHLDMREQAEQEVAEAQCVHVQWTTQLQREDMTIERCNAEAPQLVAAIASARQRCFAEQSAAQLATTLLQREEVSIERCNAEASQLVAAISSTTQRCFAEQSVAQQARNNCDVLKSELKEAEERYDTVAFEVVAARTEMMTTAASATEAIEGETRRLREELRRRIDEFASEYDVNL